AVQDPPDALDRLAGCVRLRLLHPEVVAKLVLGHPEPARPEAGESGAGGGEEVGADGRDAGSLAQSWDGLERDLLRQVFGVGSVADSCVDEGVNELQLLECNLGCWNRGDRARMKLAWPPCFHATRP